MGFYNIACKDYKAVRGFALGCILDHQGYGNGMVSWKGQLSHMNLQDLLTCVFNVL